jgi:hypothetical protein
MAISLSLKAVCPKCHNEFRLALQIRPGQLCNCCVPVNGTVLHGGVMIYEHKTAGYIEIKTDIEEARVFNKMNARANGQSPIRCIIAAKETRESSELDGKRGSGAEFHAQYYSRLGEKRTVHDRRTQ